MEKLEIPLFIQALLQANAIGAPWAKASLSGSRLGLWPAHATGCCPTHARHGVATTSVPTVASSLSTERRRKPGTKRG
jgi:hypothetical protein